MKLKEHQHWLCLLALAGLAACGGENSVDGDEPAVSTTPIEGHVFCRERMMLPPGAEVEVQLQDVSRPDAMATVVKSVRLTPRSGPPYEFVIDYDPASIDSRMTYALRATIRNDGGLLFTSTEYIDPFQGNPVEILVQRVPEPVRHEAPALEGTTWILATLAGESAPAGAGGKPVDLQISADEGRAAGFSGCNRYTGSYVREGVTEHGSPLRLGPMAGTLMACEEGAELERAYQQMLGAVTAFRFDGDTLVLLSGPEEVATFKPS
jgi:putative lipoprotein